jgi:acetyl-CoA C-acetyltransferase
MAANGRAAFTAAGIGADEVGHVDLYSCFPSAVQMGATALGMGLDRPLTVTGGLSFCGGPLNNYVTHSIASMVDVLRAQPGSIGLVTANGWYATKHSIGIYSTEPPLRPYSHTDAQPEVDRLPDRAGAPDHTGPVRAEAWSVMHERDGAPNLGLVACLTDDGRRTWGTTRDVDTLGALMTAEEAGPAELDPDGTVHLT